jgi:hypothetical protein
MTSSTDVPASTNRTWPRGVSTSPADRSPNDSDRCEQRGHRTVDRAGLGGASHERQQLLRRARRRELLLRLDADAAQQPVGVAVEEPDQRPRHGREHALERHDDDRRRERSGDGDVLGHQLTEDHLEPGRHDQGQHQGDALDGLRRATPAEQQRARSARPATAREEADQERGDGDPELGAGQLRRQRSQARQHAGGTTLTGRGARLDVPRSTVTRLNSAATKRALAAISSSATGVPSRTHSISDAMTEPSLLVSPRLHRAV